MIISLQKHYASVVSVGGSSVQSGGASASSSVQSGGAQGQQGSINSILSAAATDSTQDISNAINQQYAAEMGNAYIPQRIDTSGVIQQIKKVKSLQSQIASLRSQYDAAEREFQRIQSGGGHWWDSMMAEMAKMTLDVQIRTAAATLPVEMFVAETEFYGAAYGVTSHAGVSQQDVNAYRGTLPTEKISNYYNDIMVPIANLVNTLVNKAGITSQTPNINLQPHNTQSGLSTLRQEALGVVANRLNGVSISDISNYRGANVNEKIANYYDDVVNPIEAVKQKLVTLGVALPPQFNPPTYTSSGLASIRQHLQNQMRGVMDSVEQAGGLVGFISSIQQGASVTSQDLITVSQNLVNHVKNSYGGVTDQSLLGTSNFDYSSNPIITAHTVQQKVSDFYNNLANPINTQIQELAALGETLPSSFTDGGTPPKVLYTQANLGLITQHVTARKSMHARINALIDDVKSEFRVSNVQYNQDTITALEKAKQIVEASQRLKSKGWAISNLQATDAVLASLRAAENTQSVMDGFFSSSDSADSILSGMKSALDDQSYAIRQILNKKKKELEDLRLDLNEAREHIASLNSLMPADKDGKHWIRQTTLDFMNARGLAIANPSGLGLTQTQFRSNIETIRGYVEKKNNEVQMLMQEVQHFTNLQLQGPDLMASVVQEIYQQRFGIAGSVS